MVPEAHGEKTPDPTLVAEDERGKRRRIAILRRADQSRFIIGGRGRIHAFWK